VILPDADRETTTQIVSDSAYGCAGQRCLAVSVAVTVGDAHDWFRKSITDLAASLKVGNGQGDGIQMGPVINPASKHRIESLIAKGAAEGAKTTLDGRGAKIAGYEHGNFVGPTVLDGVPASSELTETEIFGPVLSVIRAANVDEAIAIITRSSYGNASSIFTTSGAAARSFNQISTGNVGVNIGVPRPWRTSTPADGRAVFRRSACSARRRRILHRQKVVIERWPKEWSRKF
jgi:malonate-semialdehyde dehydrogenase (acetylating)/methylmalonate-semialdehyde dehydrogenase